jgi:DHA1 family inner membrane transport protein
MDRHASSSHRPGLLVLAVAYFTFGTGSLAVVGLLDPMAQSLGAHPADVAQLVTVFALTFAFAAPGFQILFSRWPRRSLLLLGLAVLAVGCLGAAIAPTLSVAIAARIVMALGSAAIGPMSSALAAGMVPVEEQARALSFVFGGLIVSTVMGVPLATWVGHALSWQGVFIVLASLAVLCIPGAMHFIHDRRAGMPIRPGALLEVLRDPATAWGILCTLLQSGGQFASYTLIAALMTERFALDPAHVSLALLLFGIGGVAGNTLGGRLGDRVRPLQLIWTSVAGMSLLFIAMSLAPRNAVVGLALFMLWAVLAMLFQAPQQKRLLGLAPRLGGLVLALNSSAMYIGMSLGAWSGAFAYRTWGVASMPMVSTLLLVLAVGSLLLSQREPRPVAP